jgi:hypothetical protein
MTRSAASALLIPILVLVGACVSGAAPSGSASSSPSVILPVTTPEHLPGGPGIAGQALAGPTCPVVRPGDSNCNDRPVAGATILIRDAGGTVVAQVTTDANGRFQVAVPPGSYRIEPQQVTGLMGTASPINVTVGSALETVKVAYDTGIR